MDSVFPLVNFTDILQIAYEPIFCPKNYESQIVIIEMFCKTLLYKKVASKMLVKLTPLLLYLVLSKAVSLKNSTLHMLLKI